MTTPSDLVEAFREMGLIEPLDQRQDRETVSTLCDGMRRAQNAAQLQVRRL